MDHEHSRTNDADDAAQAAARSETTLDAELLDLLPDALAGVDASQRIVAWNRAAERLYGFTREEALGRSVTELLRSRFVRPLPEILEELAETGRWCGLVIDRAKDGRPVTVHARWVARHGEGGARTGVIMLSRDVELTGEHEREEESGVMSLHLLASAVAHDLNNVLTVIVNYAALVAGELDRSRAAPGGERGAALDADVAEIRTAARRGAQLTRRLIAATLVVEPASPLPSD